MRQFPIMVEWDPHNALPEQLRSIPWDLIAPHAAQAAKNHYQSLETLAARGGLCPLEAVAVLEDVEYRKRWTSPHKTRDERIARCVEALNRLRELCAAYEARTNPKPKEEDAK